MASYEEFRKLFLLNIDEDPNEAVPYYVGPEEHPAILPRRMRSDDAMQTPRKVRHQPKKVAAERESKRKG